MIRDFVGNIKMNSIKKNEQILNINQVKSIKESDFIPYKFDYDTFFANFLGYFPIKDKVKKYPFDIDDEQLNDSIFSSSSQ